MSNQGWIIVGWHNHQVDALRLAIRADEIAAVAVTDGDSAISIWLRTGEEPFTFSFRSVESCRSAHHLMEEFLGIRSGAALTIADARLSGPDAYDAEPVSIPTSSPTSGGTGSGVGQAIQERVIRAQILAALSKTPDGLSCAQLCEWLDLDFSAIRSALLALQKGQMVRMSWRGDTAIYSVPLIPFLDRDELVHEDPGPVAANTAPANTPQRAFELRRNILSLLQENASLGERMYARQMAEYLGESLEAVRLMLWECRSQGTATLDKDGTWCLVGPMTESGQPIA